MVDARAIDVHNRLATSRCDVVFCSCFGPNCCCQSDACDTCGYSTAGASKDKNEWRGFGRGDSTTPPPQETCMCACDAACDANYGAKKMTGSQPCKMIIEKTKHHSNYLLVPVNVSKQYVAELHDRPGLKKYSALNELSDERNNAYWRDTVCDNNTSTTEHLTAFAQLANNEADNYVQNMLDKYLPRRQ